MSQEGCGLLVYIGSSSVALSLLVVLINPMTGVMLLVLAFCVVLGYYLLRYIDNRALPPESKPKVQPPVRRSAKQQKAQEHYRKFMRDVYREQEQKRQL
jgi:hypothetical protein